MDENNVRILAGAVVCQDVLFEGPHPIEIGPGCVLNPRCHLIASGGPIKLGQDNIVEELVRIENLGSEVLTIGSKNLFQVGAQIECKSIGDLNVFEVKSFVPEGCTIGNGCVVGTSAYMEENMNLDDECVLFRCDKINEEEIHIRQARRLKEQHGNQIERYMDITRNNSAKTALAKFHKLIPPIES